MTQPSTNSRGAELYRRLSEGIRACGRSLRDNARDLPLLRGVNQNCVFTRLQENVLSEAADLLVASGQIYIFGNQVVMEVGEGDRQRLCPLAFDGRVESAASSLLANLFICESRSQNDETPPAQFAPPRGLVELIVNHRPTLERLPAIETYSRRPQFDENFTYRDSGWHPSVGYLIHSPEIEPLMPTQVFGQPRDNVPPMLGQLLRGFLLKSDVDLINVVGVLLTGLLIGMFVSRGKAVVLFDGNQPGVGKTWLARVIGIILDGEDPDLIHFTSNDEELGKRICAGLRGRLTSILLIDNGKLRNGDAINSTVIEANSVAPRISLRILGKSQNYTRPNDLLWLLTMNDTKTSQDLASRSLPIQFHYAGDPGQRDFSGCDPLVFALQHRNEILGELAGLAIRWIQLGRPLGRCRHRLQFWASIVGGILDANGLFGFLDNMNEAVSAFNTGLEELAALAEVALNRHPRLFRIIEVQEDHNDNGN